MNLRPGPGHLTDELSEYAAGRLPDVRALHWDRHLVACETCRASVSVERRLQAVMTAGPSMPSSLRTTLIAMGADLSLPASMPVSVPAQPVAARVSAGRRVPSVPDVPPAPFGLTLPTAYALPTVRPTSPPLHRSPLRSAVMATVVAGASAAAAWGLGVTTGATGVATSGVRPAPAATTATTRAAGSSGSSGGLGTQIGSPSTAVPAAYRWTAQMAGLRVGPTEQAQSTP